MKSLQKFINKNSDKEYILEVYVEYTTNLHNSLDELPFLPYQKE